MSGNTGILGSSKAILGRSFVLGAGAASGPVGPTVPASASNALSLTQSVNYVGPHAVSASSAISLTQTVTYGRQFNLSVSHSLAMTVAAPQPTGKRSYFVTSAIALNSIGDTRTKVRQITQPVGLTQSATYILAKHVRDVIALSDHVVKGLITLSVTTHIALSQDARTPVKKAVSHAISLTQTAHSSMRRINVSETIALTQTLGVQRPWHLAVTDPIVTLIDDAIDPVTLVVTPAHTVGLSDAVTVNRRQPYVLRQYISLVDAVACVRVKASAISPTITAQTISLVQTARLSKPRTVSQALTITQTVVAHRATPVSSSLTLTDVATQIIRRGLSPTDPISVTQATSFVLQRGNTLHVYSPFIGTGTGTPPAATLPVLAGLPGGVRFRLQHPYTSPTDTVDLKHGPAFGNRDRLQFTRINRTTRGGTLIIYADPIWPKVEVLLFTFPVLSPTEASTLQEFMRAHVGREIAMYDHEGRKWRGVITNPNDPVVQESRTNYSASFEFEGVPV